MPINTIAEIENFLTGRLSEQLGIPVHDLDLQETFSSYGLDSAGITTLIADLGRALGRKLSPTLAWQYPSIKTLAAYLKAGAIPDSRRAPATQLHSEPIAIIGMACRFPKASSIKEFWQLLLSGTDAISEAPKERWYEALLYPQDNSARANRDHRWGGFLEQVDQFDPLFFGISPAEAAQLDPQQRLMLELSWEALEDAGIPPHTLRESRTGVYFGVMWPEYAVLLNNSGPSAFTQHTVLGALHCFIPNRVSYVFGLQGPSIALDSACSSSLTAVHLACDSLRRGECTMTLVGGVNLNLLAETTLIESRVGALSADGRCHTFDAQANGCVRGEGGGVIVLKPLSQAILDNDPIYCVIRGSAVNNDGPSNGFSAPNPRAQEAMLREAYSTADLLPSEVDYVELHGTGTPLGDPIEAEALGRVLCAGRPAARPLLVGSVKTNIGHLEAAAGIAGLIKTALSIKHRIIPPSLNFKTLNPHIPAELPLRVQNALVSWPERDQPALAGVSSFGMGGTNAHVVVQGLLPQRAELLALSGASAEDLQVPVQQLLARLNSAAPTPTPNSLHSAQSFSGTDQSFRLAVTVRSTASLRQALDGYLTGHKTTGLAVGQVDGPHRPKVAFILSGGGSQWYGMARALLQQEPVFRGEIEQCDRLIIRHLDWSLIAELLAPKDRSRVDEIDVICAGIVAIEIALVALLRSWGIEPTAVLGHSIGEIAAAHVSGALSRDDAMRVICTQGRVLRRIRGQGAMGLVGLGWEAAAAALSRYQERLFCSIQVSADATVVSGSQEALDEAFAALEREGVFCRQVRTEVATHCPRIEPLQEAIKEQLSGLAPARARIPIVSTLTGSWLEGEHFGVEHWVRHQAEPVWFSRGISALIDAGYDLFVEIAPHPVVKTAIESALREKGKRGLVLATMQRDKDERGSLLDMLGACYVQGLPVRWRAVLSGLSGQAADAHPAHDAGRAFLLPLSTRSAEALPDLARAYRELATGNEAELQDIAYTASVRRSHHSHRLAVVGSTKQQLNTLLSAFLEKEDRPGLAAGRALSERHLKVVFVFSGFGSQWPHMAKQLLAEEPVFRASVAKFDAVARKETGRSILGELLADEALLDRPDIIQPVLLALQIALAELLRSWGVVPDAVVGHSMGEVAAAYVSGALSLEDAVRVVCRRSQLMQKISGKGAMAMVELSSEQAQQVVHEHAKSLAVAICNGPRTTVLSGDPQALEEVLTELRKKGVFCRRLQGANVASHSPQADALHDELLAALATVTPRVPPVPMHSTVTAQQVSDASLDAAYWFRNMRQPVLFWPTIEHLVKGGHQIFIELSPHPILVPAVHDSLRQLNPDAIALGTLRREQPERRCLLETLAELYVRGREVNWASLYAAGGSCVSLPAYPWQRERYWVEEASSGPSARGRQLGGSLDAPAHPLLGHKFTVSTQPGALFWEQQLSLHRSPMLNEHRVKGQAVFPGTGYLEMVHAAARQVYGKSTLVVEGVRFERMLKLDTAESCTVQTVLTEGGPEGVSFQIASLQGSEWLRHASGKLKALEATELPGHFTASLEEIKQRCPSHQKKEEFYQGIVSNGGEYGPQFQGVEELWIGKDELLGRLKMPESVAAQALAYQIHPAWLDACLHTVLGSAQLRRSGLWGPVMIDRLQMFRPLDQQVFVHAVRNGQSSDAAVELDYSLRVLAEDGQVLLTVQGLKLARIVEAEIPAGNPQDELLYEVQWQAQPLPAGRSPSSVGAGPWLVLMDRGGVGEQLLELFRQQGQAYVKVELGEQYQCRAVGEYQLDPGSSEGYGELLRASLGEAGLCKGIIHLWSLDALPGEQTTLASLDHDQRLGYLSALHLVQEMGQASWRDSPPIYFLTKGLVSIAGESGNLYPSQAPLWGLGKVISVERPGLTCRRIDLDAGEALNQAEQLFNELLASTREEEVALRQGTRYVSRLVRSRLKELVPKASAHIRRDSSYLVTGGLRGLGLAAAEWLVSEGARHLVLIGRSLPEEGARSTIARLQGLGIQVITAQVDVSDYQQLAKLLSELDGQLPPLAGVIHSAAVLDDGLLESQTAERFHRVMAPKVRGAWNLHLLTEKMPLDFFVCYASVASLLGSPGQANYVAANAFLDAFAHYRQRTGRCTTSINWGIFTEEGMATVQDNLDARWSARGMQSLTLPEAKQIFFQLLADPRAQLGVVKLDARKWVEYYPYLAGAPFWAELIQAQERLTLAHENEAAPWRTALLKVNPTERAALLEGLLAKQVGRVLRLEARRIDRQMPLRQLGVDSLMSLEIRNLLELNLGMKLPAVVLLTHPTLEALGAHLLEKLALTGQVSPDTLPMAPVAGSAPAAENLNDMTEADLLTRLKNELALAKKGGKS